MLVASLGGAVLAVALIVALAATDYWRVGHPLADCDRSPGWHAGAALVPSGAPHLRRTRIAVAAWRAGHVDRIVISGAGSGGDNAGYVAGHAERELHVPAAVFTLETRARSTYQNLAYSCPVLARLGVARAALVTDPWHLTRAMASARAACRTVHFCGLTTSNPITPARRRHETVALLAYQLSGRAVIF